MLAAATPTRKSDGHDTGPRSFMYGADGGTGPPPLDDGSVPILPVPARDGTTRGGEGEGEGGAFPPTPLLLGGGEESNLRGPATDDIDDGVLTDGVWHNLPPICATLDVIAVLRNIMVAILFMYGIR